MSDPVHLASIGRTEEKASILETLEKLLNNIKDLDIESQFPLINITGKMGVGKTHFLKWLMNAATSMNFHTFALVENSDFEKPFDNAKNIVKQILHKNLIDNEHKIMELLGEDSNKYPLQILNQWMNTKFSIHTGDEHDTSIRELMVKLISKCTKGAPILIGVDNAENTGIESWMFFRDLLKTKAACIVTTFTEEFNSGVPFISQLISHEYQGILLKPYNVEEIGLLACQFLDIMAIHKGFLRFLADHSNGNSLRLQEILVLPQLQHYYCIVSSNSVTRNTLLANFFKAEGVTDEQLLGRNSKVCDLLDADNLESVYVPGQLIDVIKEHTSGLSPEDQMLMRKAACLGDDFSFYVIEAVSPEYSTEELKERLNGLLQKKILGASCSHYVIPKYDSDANLQIVNIALDFCLHKIHFLFEFFRSGILSTMGEVQRERVHLYIVDRLARQQIVCDSCRKEQAVVPRSKNLIIPEFILPHVDFRLCQCLNLKTHILEQVEYHLNHGRADIILRIHYLKKAVESALFAQNIEKAQAVLYSIKQLLQAYVNNTGDNTIHPIQVAVERLKTRVMISQGKNTDALRLIKNAMAMMGIVFPNDYEKRNYKKIRTKGEEMVIEEVKCIAVSACIEKALGNYELGFRLAEFAHELVTEYMQNSYRENINAKRYALSLASQTEKRQKRVNQWINVTYRKCYDKLTTYPVLEIIEIQATVKALITVVRILFENNELEKALKTGLKVFQLLKVMKYKAFQSKIAVYLALIYLYQKNVEKCFEMTYHLQDCYQQTGNLMAEAAHFFVLSKVLRRMGHPGSRMDKINMCSQYVRSKISLQVLPKQEAKWFCITVQMALWACERGLEESISVWQEQAVVLQENIRLNNFWALNGALNLLYLPIARAKNSPMIYTIKDFAIIQEKTDKELAKLIRNIKTYCPVLDYQVKEIEITTKNLAKDVHSFSK